ncbi:MAG TPA: Fic family protein [Candidatus Saccharimonadales bacterium]|nr:Fic family protein [Candidatus Saccharimonadales bacterium]
MPNIEADPQRIDDATQLVEDFNLHEDAEIFADPSNRVEFLTSLNAEDFFDISQHVNARVRGFEPRDKVTANEEGGYLPALGTPEASEKRQAFTAGFDTIKDYLLTSTDDPEQKVKGAAMAAEALIIWVHPFNDGNGRTSRFLGKFIEDGTTDTDQLIAETADKNNRLRMYKENLRVDKANVYKGIDVVLDDDEEEELKATEMPVSEGISRSLKRLLEDKTVQAKVEAQTARYQAAWEASQAKAAA